MTPDQRDKLLDLHRAAMKETAKYSVASLIAQQRGAPWADPRDMDAADDAFRDYLMSLPVSDG